MADIPERVRVLILGGGIHGAGVLHDLASRGWRDVLLVERNTLGAGTSRWSTKLIHGGLRYLQRLRDYGLVSEALNERRRLLNLAPDLVRPVPLVFPILRQGGMPSFYVRTGLRLYDWLAGSANIGRHRKLSLAEAEEMIPGLRRDELAKAYLFWDCQTDDLALVRRVAASARQLGAQYLEGAEALKIEECPDGWQVHLRVGDETRTIGALYVINALGPWAHNILLNSRIRPTHRAINNKGTHLVLPDCGFKAGLFVQSPEDGRIMFVLPWQGFTLVGTTETIFDDDPDLAHPESEEEQYLLERVGKLLDLPPRRRRVLRRFSGLRWLPVEQGRDISATSRSAQIGVNTGERGFVVTIYGGKLTTYRLLARKLGDMIMRDFGEERPSRTDDAATWFADADSMCDVPGILDRFEAGSSGLAVRGP